MPGSDFEEIARRLRRSLVRVGSGGSGVLWDDHGHVITNAHVVRREKIVEIEAAGERKRAEVLWRDTVRDLALLDAGRFASAVSADIGDSDRVRPGQLVLAVGNPLGMRGAATLGIIHAAAESWVEADVSLAPGNSGGMLADASGRVIGITSMIVNGLAFAVPANAAATLIERLHLKRTA